MTTDVLIEGLVDLGPVRLAAGDRQFAEQAAKRLNGCPHDDVVRAVESELVRAVGRLFRSGWQPAEVVRQARRDGGAVHAALAAIAIGAQNELLPAEPIDPRWQQQLDVIGAAAVNRESARLGGWFADWWRAGGLDSQPEVMMTTFELLVTLRSLPPLEKLIPPPGSETTTDQHRAAASELSDADHRLLQRVRSLLDKAESSQFEAEAEAFTAKAHELITRHAIDMALLAGASGRTVDDELPSATRIDIDDPYADAKSLLLQVVAEANRCRTVYHDRLSLSTVLGFSADLAATELLFTSLLVQAQSALTAAARSAPPGARTRSRSYRSAFLVAYANRIGQRLDGINEHLVGEASGNVLPVLRSRAATVDDAVAARFPGLTSSPVRAGYDAAGWTGGQRAADQAKLNFADLADHADPTGGTDVADVYEPAALNSRH